MLDDAPMIRSPRLADILNRLVTLADKYPTTADAVLQNAKDRTIGSAFFSGHDYLEMLAEFEALIDSGKAH